MTRLYFFFSFAVFGVSLIVLAGPAQARLPGHAVSNLLYRQLFSIATLPAWQEWGKQHFYKLSDGKDYIDDEILKDAFQREIAPQRREQLHKFVTNDLNFDQKVTEDEITTLLQVEIDTAMARDTSNRLDDNWARTFLNNNKNAFMEFDVNNDSVITRDEMLELTPDGMRRAKHGFKLLIEPIVTAPFYADGRATYDEYQTFIADTFAKVDSNGDGTIDDTERDRFLSALDKENTAK